jgi:hypothetical protein
MEVEKLKLEAQNDELDRRLKELRKTIKGKRDNINDLESVLQQDIEKLRSFPIYYYFFLILHFAFMLYTWGQARGIIFVCHFIMYHWYIRKWYKEIAMRIAIPLSIMLIVISFSI